MIGLRAAIIAQTGGPGGKRKIIIGKKAVIMSCCIIVCSAGRTLTGGEGSVLPAGSVVSATFPQHFQPRTAREGHRARHRAFNARNHLRGFRRDLQPLRGGRGGSRRPGWLGPQISLARAPSLCAGNSFGILHNLNLRKAFSAIIRKGG